MKQNTFYIFTNPLKISHATSNKYAMGVMKGWYFKVSLGHKR